MKALVILNDAPYARGIGESDLVEGAARSSMDELTAWSLDADKVFTF